MRAMCRFTIRDLLWLTLVVAVMLAWGIRERQLRDDLRAREADAEVWRTRAQELELMMAVSP
jgi:hypothetical protein